jgi:hypothetical protein
VEGRPCALDDIDLQVRRPQSEAVLNAAEAARVQRKRCESSGQFGEVRAVSRRENERAGAPHLSQPMRNWPREESINEIWPRRLGDNPVADKEIVIDKKVMSATW